MKKFLLIYLLFAICLKATASCPPGFTEVIVHIVPDGFAATETSWNITDINGVILTSGTIAGDTICVPDTACTLFSIHDTYGDGLISPGGYWLYLNGVLVDHQSNFNYDASYAFNCPQGSHCSSPIPLAYGLHGGVYDNTWYSFTPDSTGTYRFNTCGVNGGCDTKIWIYGTCAGVLLDESPAGTYAYNDNNGCGLEADLNVVLMAGTTYYIRMGDNLNNCLSTVYFLFGYEGPVSGCTNPAACNYYPLATVDDGSCIFFPNPLCAGPDLELDSLSFINSLTLQTEIATTCDIAEGCLTGYGTRYVMAFTSKINNIGTLDYYVGNASSNPGMFNTTNCHGHSHYEGYGDYRLIDMNGNPVPVGHKNGFCVSDMCGSGQYNCGDMGISVGCYDVYGAGTQCQWIDITEVPEGDYRLAVVINALHLPDALGHGEINYLNNALQVCIHISRNAQGIPSYTLLPTCTPFVDCLGVPGGVAVTDCDGVCNGTSLFGDVQPDAVINPTDLSTYVYMLSLPGATANACNDLNSDGNLSIYDAALAGWCLYSGIVIHPGSTPHNHCQFPRNILNQTDTASLKISAVNFTNSYIDVAITTRNADIKAYQFEVSGITIQNVVSLANLTTFPTVMDFNATTNQVFAITVVDSSLQRSNNSQALCRIYYSAITDTAICISNIVDIVNRDGERVIIQVEGSCASTTLIGLAEQTPRGNITLQPNPVSGEVNIHLGAFSVTPETLVITDAMGRYIRNIEVPQSSGWFKVNLSDLKPGVYLINGRDGNGAFTDVRFVKL